MHVLLYGATGYTGRLVARMAAQQRLPIVLAGRSEGALAAVARDVRLPYRAFGLGRAVDVREGIAGAAVVLNCAGPFAHTWRPLVDACVAAGVHYVDVTGEIDVFEGIAAESQRAADAGVMLLPGAGFDVVPTDCVAAHLAARLPGARRLLLGIQGSGQLSHGTAATAIEQQHRGGRIRRNGVITTVRSGWRTRSIDFGDGRSRTAVTIPWGDVATAYHSTGIGDIEVYAAVPPAMIRAIRLSHYMRGLLRQRPVKALQRTLLRLRPAGPSERELEQGVSRVWGRVEGADERSAETVVSGPNGYLLTAHAALLIARRVLDGDHPVGFRTPSLAYGADLVLEIPGMERRDLH